MSIRCYKFLLYCFWCRELIAECRVQSLWCRISLGAESPVQSAETPVQRAESSVPRAESPEYSGSTAHKRNFMQSHKLLGATKRFFTVVVVGSLYWARSRLQPSTSRILFPTYLKSVPP